MQQEMHTLQMRQLEPVDRFAFILVPQKLLDLFSRQEAAKPVPLIVVADEQSDIGICRFVTASAHDNVPKGCPNGFELE